jgi:hypothetical protein
LWSDRLETQRATEASLVTASEQRLRQLFKIDRWSALVQSALLDRINATLRDGGIAECATPADFSECRKELDASLGGNELTARLATLASLKTLAQRLGRVIELSEPIAALHAALQDYEQVHRGIVQDVLIDLLAKGKLAIEAAGLDSCPLCEQAIDRQAVLSRIDERIRADEQITRIRTTLIGRKQALKQPLTDLHSAFKSFIDDWTTHGLGELPAGYTNDAQLLTEFIAALEDEKLSSAHVEQLTSRTHATLPNHDIVIARLELLIAREGGGEQRNHRLDAATMIDSFGRDWPTHEVLIDELRKLEIQKATIDRIHGHAVEARKIAVQKTLDIVSDTANDFYEILHPGENIATSKLGVRQAGQGSVNLSTTFYGREEPPLLHLSESHLDTLGLCYFLALRKHEAERNGNFKVLLLDDVMHSVDAEHRTRVARLLRQEFSDHQIILATHDTYFYDALRKALGNAGFSYQTISGWDIDRGPILGDPSTDLDVILDKANYTSRRTDDLSATGGRFFEWLLKQLDERLQVAVPARFERRHDVGSLWPPLCAKLKRHRGFIAQYSALAEGLDTSAWVRNACGAHDNEAESAVAPEEVREFAGYLADLYVATRCEECGTFIAKQPDDGWRCNCATLSFSARS